MIMGLYSYTSLYRPSRFARGLLHAGLLLGLALKPDPARAEFGFTEPARLRSSTVFSPAIASDQAGTFMAANTRQGGGNSFIEIARSVDNGSTWSNLTYYIPYVNYDGDASIDTDGAGRWIVAWTRRPAGGVAAEILLSESTDNGGTWSDPHAVTPRDASAQDINPVIKSDRAGHWLLVWQHKVSGGALGADDDIFYALSSDNGVQWTAAAPLNKTAATDAGIDAAPDFAFGSSGHCVAVWQATQGLGGVLGADADILYARSADYGATWSNPLPFDSNAGLDQADDTRPRIAVSLENVWLATWRNDQATRIARSTDNGANWTPMPAVPASYESQVLPLGGGRWARRDAVVGISLDDGASWIDAVYGFSGGVLALGAQQRIVELAETNQYFGGYSITSRYTDTWTSSYNTKFPPSMNHDLNAAGVLFEARLFNEGLATWNPADGIVVESTSDPCGILLAPISMPVNAEVKPGDYFVVPIAGATPAVIGVCGIDFRLNVPGVEPDPTPRLDLEFEGYAAQFVSLNVPETALPGEEFHFQMQWRNTDRLTWESSRVDLEVLAGSCSVTTASLAAATGPDQIGTFDITMVAPNAQTVCSLNLTPRFWVDSLAGSRHGLFGETRHAEVIVSAYAIVRNLGEVAQREGWFGGSVQGDGAVGATTAGVCMYVPDTGDNIVGWVSPERLLPLVDMRLMKLTVAASTSQSAVDAIPLWDVVYDNFNTSGFGNVYGGEAWFMDVAGGANGVGRPQGRNTFTVFAAPNAMLTPQWRGTIGGGAVGSNGGAFTPEADANNDMRLVLRVLDIGSGAIDANHDFGTICISRIAAVAVDYGAIASQGQIWGPAISSATHAAQTLTEAAENAGTAQIDDATHTAFYQLTASGPGSRKTLLPYDPSQGSTLAALYPVAWSSDAAYRGTTLIRSNFGGGAGPEGPDPVDAIFLDFDTTNSELGFQSFTSRGSAGNMRFAASPRLAATAGGPQTYVAFFSGANRTLSSIEDAARLRLMSEFFNTPEIAPEGQGADPVAIVGAAVDLVTAP